MNTDECRYCGAEIHSHDNWDVWLDEDGVDWCPIGKDRDDEDDWHISPDSHAPEEDL